MGTRTSVRVRRADWRLGLRLGVAAAATIGLGVPFLLLALLVRNNWMPLIRLDTAVADRMTGLVAGNDALIWVLKAVSRLSDPYVFRLAAVGVAIWLLRRRRFRIAAWTLFASLVGGLVSPTLKEIVGRARPVLDEPVAQAGGMSFPSGHATGSMIGVGVLLLVLGPLLSPPWRRLAWAAGAVTVLVVGLDRIMLGVHYLSDVLAGWVIGLAWLAVTAAVFHVWRREAGLPPAPALENEPEIATGRPESAAAEQAGVREPRTG